MRTDWSTVFLAMCSTVSAEDQNKTYPSFRTTAVHPTVSSTNTFGETEAYITVQLKKKNTLSASQDTFSLARRYGKNLPECRVHPCRNAASVWSQAFSMAGIRGHLDPGLEMVNPSITMLRKTSSSLGFRKEFWTWGDRWKGTFFLSFFILQLWR